MYAENAEKTVALCLQIKKKSGSKLLHTVSNKKTEKNIKSCSKKSLNKTEDYKV